MNGDTTGWSYDKNGNELSAAGQLPRTGETYNDFNQLTALTTGGTTSRYTYAGTDSSNRLTAGSTRIDQGPAGISTTTTTDGKSTGFVRDPAGTLIGMTSGGPHRGRRVQAVLPIVIGSGLAAGGLLFLRKGLKR
ncbi:hypothetical protein [Streptomyces griseoluteus]|uniref:hypothetical protein n=1 Tax=Streptomyces griseoluteus TaxID=29306 RepID=UPI0036FB53F6